MNDVADTSQPNREQLQANWLAWVRANLGDDAERTPLATTAATDAIVAGAGLRAAYAAATNAWIHAGGGGRRLWRMTFWGLLATNRLIWVLVPALVMVQAFWLAPLGFIAAICLTLPLAAAITWNANVAYRLSHLGVVAPGVLINVVTIHTARQGDVYRATYQFDHHGPCVASRTAGDTPQDVLVLFDPEHPGTAVVVPDSIPLGG